MDRFSAASEHPDFKSPANSRFQVPAIFNLYTVKMAVFWVVAPCRLVRVYRRFRGLYCLHHQRDRPDTVLRNAISGFTCKQFLICVLLHVEISGDFRTNRLILAEGLAVMTSCVQWTSYLHNINFNTPPPPRCLADSPTKTVYALKRFPGPQGTGLLIAVFFTNVVPRYQEGSQSPRRHPETSENCLSVHSVTKKWWDLYHRWTAIDSF
jgi:hypothetical protein